MNQRVAEVFDIAGRHHPPLLHHGEAVSRMADERHILLDKNHGQADLPVEPDDDFLNLLDDGGLDAFVRFVE